MGFYHQQDKTRRTMTVKPAPKFNWKMQQLYCKIQESESPDIGQFEKVLSECSCVKVFHWECLFVNCKKILVIDPMSKF